MDATRDLTISNMVQEVLDIAVLGFDPLYFLDCHDVISLPFSIERNDGETYDLVPWTKQEGKLFLVDGDTYQVYWVHQDVLKALRTITPAQIDRSWNAARDIPLTSHMRLEIYHIIGTCLDRFLPRQVASRSCLADLAAGASVTAAATIHQLPIEQTAALATLSAA